MSKTLRNIIIVCVAAMAIIAASLIALTSCNGKKVTGKTSQEALDVYAFTAVSGASLLAESFGSETPAGISDTTVENADATTRPDGITDDDAARIKQYLGMFEGYILNNGISAEATVPDESDGDYAGYQHKMSIVLPNAEGGNDSFAMYYNELDGKAAGNDKAAAVAEEEKDGEDGEKEDSSAGAENETEIESGIEGVMVYRDHAYPLTGEKEIETEGNETESELSIKVYLSENERGTNIAIKQEIEQDEIEYVYSVYDNGKLTNRTSVEFENDAEENEQEIKLSFRDNTAEASTKTWYQIEKNDGEEAMFSVKYKAADGSVYKFDIDVNEGAYTFIYRNGFSEII